MVVAFVLPRPLRAWPALLVGALVVLAGGVAVSTAPPARAEQDPVSCAESVGLVNGGFEQPVIADDSFRYVQESQVPGWVTTATDLNIEIWRNNYRGVSAALGSQFAELNATQFSTLYQDLPTVPGTVLRWSLQHRGRDGVDTMEVNIGPAGAQENKLVRQRVITDGNTAWGTYSGLYTVPKGQTTTRFAFAAVDTHGSNISVGNFLDDIYFGTSACVVATGSVSSPTGKPYAQAGDVLTLRFDASSGGGNPASAGVLHSPLPPGVEFVPGSIRVTYGGSVTSLSNGAGDDVGEYDPVTHQVVVRVGTGADAAVGGLLRAGDATQVTYQVRVIGSNSPSTFVGDSVLSFYDPLTGTTRTATTNPVTLTLNPLADLQVAVTRTSAGPVVAGNPVSYDVTLLNKGNPSADADHGTAYSTRLTSELPAALGDVRATTTGGTCTVAGGTLDCDFGVLAKSATRTVRLEARVLPDTAPATAGLVLTMTGSTVSRELDRSNDTASATDDVVTRADVGVTLTAAPTSLTAGRDVTYTAVLTNRGPSTARTVVLRDPLPAGTSAPRASVPGGTCTAPPAGPVTCTIPAVASGTSTTVTIVLRVDPARTSPVSNTVTVSAATPDPAAGNNSATVVSSVQAMADIRAVLTVPAGNVPLGGSTTYRLVVTNTGPSTAVNIAFGYAVPAGITPEPPAGNWCTFSGCRIPSLAPGASVELTGVLQVAATTQPGRALVSATARAATNDPALADNTSQATVFVGAPSLAVSVIGAITDTRRTSGARSAGGALPADDVVWTYVVANTGDVDLTALTVVLPGSVTDVGTTCRPGTLPVGAVAACHGVTPQQVTATDAATLSVTTTVEVTAQWAGQTEVRSPSALGSLRTRIPDQLRMASATRPEPEAGTTAPAGMLPGLYAAPTAAQ